MNSNCGDPEVDAAIGVFDGTPWNQSSQPDTEDRQTITAVAVYKDIVMETHIQVVKDIGCMHHVLDPRFCAVHICKDLHGKIGVEPIVEEFLQKIVTAVSGNGHEEDLGVACDDTPPFC